VLPASAVLFREGDPGDAFYIVGSGTLQVLLTPSAGVPQALATMDAGHLVGEIAVLYRRPQTSTVSAVTASTLFKIRGSTLDRLLATNPSAYTQLLEATSRRLPSSYLASVPIFAGLDAHALRELDLESSWVWLAGGQTLFRQADLVLMVASAEGTPSRSEVAQRLFEADAVARSATKELVLLHAPTTKHPSGTARWLAAYPVSRHHHIRMDSSEDYARLAKNAQSGCQDIQFPCPRIESCPRNVQ
jgi:hypothetical protein